jgi:hypothetical protein
MVGWQISVAGSCFSDMSQQGWCRLVCSCSSDKTCSGLHVQHQSSSLSTSYCCNTSHAHKLWTAQQPWPGHNLQLQCRCCCVERPLLLPSGLKHHGNKKTLLHTLCSSLVARLLIAVC